MYKEIASVRACDLLTEIVHECHSGFHQECICYKHNIQYLMAKTMVQRSQHNAVITKQHEALICHCS